MDHDNLVNKRVVQIARDYGATVDQVNADLDHHPIELDRDRYLKRTLAVCCGSTGSRRISRASTTIAKPRL